MRTVHEDDLPTYERAVERSRERLAPWNPVNPRDLLAHLEAQSRGHRTFVVHAREPVGDHDVVGKVNVTGVSRGRFLSGSLGYDAYDPYAGQGLFAEGMRLVIGLAFAPEPRGMGLHRLEASVQPGNVRSAGLLRSLGFGYEGFSPRMLWLADGHGAERWRDHDRYALTAECWPPEPYAARAHRPLVAVVGGPPSEGRSSLAAAVAAELGVPVLPRDLVGAVAVWPLLAASPAGAVIEGCFTTDDLPEVDAALRGAGLDPARVPEVWCVPEAGADGSVRAAGTSGGAGAPAAPQPLGLGPVHVVDVAVSPPPGVVVRLALAVRGATAG